ncbi:hypothetical protein C8R45DRAFT_411541 [Mycena sanguinolenta]|nr:hypothetical protein C8R45DRAFT_411541 [Mycena sanguinolenta]
MYYNALPVWMRPTTGELCLDLVQGPPTDFGRPWWKAHILRLDNLLLDDPNAEAAVISNLTEEEYHELCSMPSIAGYWTSTVSTQQPIELGPVIFRSDSSRQTLFKITQALDLDHEQELRWRGCGVREGESLPNFWTRYDSRQACGLHLILLVFRSSKTSKFWMAQANHTFTRLQTISRFEDYVCMNSIEFVFRILPSPRNTQESKGYLFVCPPEDFRTGPNTFQWPDCPAYWSLDPFGDVHLSSEDARDLGFPIIHIETRLKGVSWDGSIYEGLRRFHQIKGFDSDSQDVAKHLEYPLFEQSTEDGATLAFGRAVL